MNRTKEIKRGLGLRSPPINDITMIFEDMTRKAFEDLEFNVAVDYLENRLIRVATMCSGTESPLLALGLISDALQTLGAKRLHIHHCFSGEIVPFKQAFIERNFSPNILFRDITELSNGENAATAYGQVVKIPREVDMLVAGFSCVDFSGLNREKKTLSDGGESGTTFVAIHRYIVQHRPALCILENIMGAPWEFITHLFQNDHEWLEENEPNWESQWGESVLGYAAKHVAVDSKRYYIPQTRTRGYLLLVDRKTPEADNIVEKWEGLMRALERKASSPFGDFLMDKDDPQLSRARADMTNSQGREYDWTLCRGRYAEYREQKNLGHKRPLTRWKNGGSCQLMDHWWRDWMEGQVERVFDTLEINHLWNAAFRNTDNRYKPRMTELSQNVDRAEDTNRPGIISCLTPSGAQFISNEGRPLTGREALGLQGLPLHNLLITRESQKEQLDLAGNAMTTTVVGAAIIAALIAGYAAIDVKDRVIQPPDEIPKSEINCSALGPHQILDLDIFSKGTLQILKKIAKQSAAFCRCESQNQLADQEILICKDCDHTSCRGCAGIPEHNYTEMTLGSRVDPSLFKELLKDALPMRLKLKGLDTALELCKTTYGMWIDDIDWRIFKDAVIAISEEEYQFYGATRSRQWIAKYDASRSYLELTMDEDCMYWQLYGKSASEESVNSRVRKLLRYPLARLELFNGEDIFTGQWALTLPIIRKFSLKIQGLGESVPSWEAELGIQTEELKDTKIFKRLSVEIDGYLPFTNHDSLTNKISGEYKLHPGCGTSFNSMHSRKSSKDRPVYFWLDVESIGESSDDRFAFSNYSYHVGTEQQRNELASISSSWRPNQTRTQRVDAKAYGLRVNCETAVLQCVSDLEPSYIAIPRTNLSISVAQDITPSSSDRCFFQTTALLHIMAHSSRNDVWGNGTWSMPSQIDERYVVPSLAWLTERAREMGRFSKEWRPLKLTGPISRCHVCAPKYPEIKWGRKGNRAVAAEDAQKAAAFERAMKTRKSLFTLSRWNGKRSNVENEMIDSDVPIPIYNHLLVGLNFAALAHRVLAKFENIENTAELKLSWRLNTNCRWPKTMTLPKFSLKNNKNTRPEAFSFINSDEGLRLRDDQARSLRWMIDQELQPSGFREQEIAEEYFPQLNWLIEALVTKPCLARGGLLADEVGYGKTATTLALIDQTQSEAAQSAKIDRRGTISLKATLIVVPQTLIKQWENQIRKFLGESYTVLVIATMVGYAKKSIRSFQNADIVLVASGIFKSPVHLKRIAEFTALPELLSTERKTVRAWIDRAPKIVASHMDQLLTSQQNISDFHNVLQSRVEALEGSEGFSEHRPLGRLRDRIYDGNFEKQATAVAGSLSVTPDSFGFKASSSLKDIQGPLLQMFHFHRLVIDEYTYTEDNEMSLITSIQSSNRWVLSGTPRLGDFSDVKTIAQFLGVDLGIDDDAGIALKAHNAKKMRKLRTTSEQFQAYSETRTPAWHMVRHEHAQDFLDCFARQNTPEIGRILMEEHLRPINLSGVERAIYIELELQIQVRGTDPPFSSTQISTSDQIRRFRKILFSTKSSEEALLKRCSYFVPENSTFIHTRYLELEEISATIVGALKRAYVWQQHYDGMNKPPGDPSFFIKWLNEQNAKSEDPECTGKILAWLNYSQKYCHVTNDKIFNRDHQTSHFLENEIKIQSSFVGPTETQDKELMKGLTVRFKSAMLAKIRGRKATRVSKKAADNSEGETSDDSEAAPIGRAINEGKATKKETARTKAPRVSKKAADISEGETSDDSETALEGKASNKGKTTKKETAIAAANKQPSGEAEDVSQVLRNLTHYIRLLQNELISRTRSFRYAISVRKILNWHSGAGLLPRCENCDNGVMYPSTTSIFRLCGHLLCHDCLSHAAELPNEDDEVECPIQNCNAIMEAHCGIPASILLSHSAQNPSAYMTEPRFLREEPYGAKFNAIIHLIKEEIPEDEQVLLFIPFPDLINYMMQAFELHAVNFLAVLDSSRESAKLMNSFQDNNSETKSKVLILNPLDESAAGVNLVNANHVIFISSMFANTTDEQNQAITQSIGRAKRFGQRKTVHVYTFLALHTIDIEILQNWKEKRLVQTEGGKWELKTKAEMSRKERKQDWGPIFTKKRKDIVKGKGDSEEDTRAPNAKMNNPEEEHGNELDVAMDEAGELIELDVEMEEEEL